MSAPLSQVLEARAGTSEYYGRDDIPVCQEKIHHCLLHIVCCSPPVHPPTPTPKHTHTVREGGGGGTPPQMAVCWGKISCLSDPAQKQGPQHWKGPKISSWSLFLGLPYVLQAILAYPLLLHPAGAEHKPSSLSLPHQVTPVSSPVIFTAQCWAHSNSSTPFLRRGSTTRGTILDVA